MKSINTEPILLNENIVNIICRIYREIQYKEASRCTFVMRTQYGNRTEPKMYKNLNLSRVISKVLLRKKNWEKRGCSVQINNDPFDKRCLITLIIFTALESMIV